MAKDKNKNILYFLIAVILVTAFFVHEFIEKQPDEWTKAYNTHLTQKKIAQKKLNLFKKSFSNSPEYLDYEKEKIKRDLLWKEFGIIKTNSSFLGFKTLQQFLGELGWAIGLLIYSLFNLSLVFIRKNKTMVGEIVLHSTLTFISLYFINWAFQKSNDYSKLTYILYAIAMAIIFIYGTHLLVKYKNNYISSLKGSVVTLIDFISIKAKVKYVSDTDKLQYTKDYLVELKKASENG